MTEIARGGCTCGTVSYARADTPLLLGWDQYRKGKKFSFVRLEISKDPTVLSPDAHFRTSTKPPWLESPDNGPAFPEMYQPKEVWSEESQARRKIALAQD